MNWQLLTSVLFGLNVVLYNFGLSSYSGGQNHRSYAAIDAVQVSATTDTTQIPFTLDLQENQGAEEIFSLRVSIPAVASGTINATLDDQYFTSFYVLDGDSRIIAKDVVAPDIKTSLVFNATNSARAEVVEALALSVIPFSELKGLYDEIDDHPRFLELISLYSQDAQTRDYFELGQLSVIIANDLITPC